MPAKKQLLSKYKNKQVKLLDRYMNDTFQCKLIDFDSQFALVETTEKGEQMLINIHEILGLKEVITDA